MRALASGLLALGLSATTSWAAGYPFEGSWGGGPTTCADPFRFSATTYRPPGGEPMPILRVARRGAGYRLSFKDGYTVVLSGITQTSLGWFSEASGDGFTLTRCRGPRVSRPG